MVMEAFLWHVAHVDIFLVSESVWIFLVGSMHFHVNTERYVGVMEVSTRRTSLLSPQTAESVCIGGADYIAANKIIQ
jgi:hypothetical protein